jgi:hypothetical protein
MTAKNFKECCDCGKVKILEEFGFKNTSTKIFYDRRCLQCRRLNQKKYYYRTKERFKEARKRAYIIWYKKSAKKIAKARKLKRKLGQNKNERNWYNKRYRDKKSDMEYVLTERLRHRIYLAVKGANKSDTTANLIGCSIAELMEHLQNQFKPGMSWENYGKWHIDHIVPCASFDLSKEEEQRKCFHFNNLQPLWAQENLKKSNKVCK